MSLTALTSNGHNALSFDLDMKFDRNNCIREPLFGGSYIWSFGII